MAIILGLLAFVVVSCLVALGALVAAMTQPGPPRRRSGRRGGADRDGGWGWGGDGDSGGGDGGDGGGGGGD